jgi:hypothetical protein
VKDLDFERREITVRRGKGQTDRRVMLPDLMPYVVHHISPRALNRFAVAGSASVQV